MYNASEKRYENMKYNYSGKSGLQLPAVSLGLWHNFGTEDNFETMQQMIFTAFDNGITHFDLANNYGPVPGSAEENMGKIIKNDMSHYRDEIIISSKAGYKMWDGPYGDFGSRKYILASLDQSLERTGLEYFDIFYHHRPDPNTPLEESMGALAFAVASGKAIYAGISNYDGPLTMRAAEILTKLNCPFVINQSSYSILNRNIESNGLLKQAKSVGAGIIAFCPLAQGLLTDKYLNGVPTDSRIKKSGVFLKESSLTNETLAKIRSLNDIALQRGETLAQMALAWVLAKGCASVLIGASRPSQIIENVKVAKAQPFSEEQLKQIDEISK